MWRRGLRSRRSLVRGLRDRLAWAAAGREAWASSTQAHARTTARQPGMDDSRRVRRRSVIRKRLAACGPPVFGEPVSMIGGRGGVQSAFVREMRGESHAEARRI